MMKKIIHAIKKIGFFFLSLSYLTCSLAYAAGLPSSSETQKSTNETVKLLQSLTQYEIDNSFLISQCMDNVKSQALQAKLMGMKKESESNIEELSNLVKKYGGEVPGYSKDFKGFFMKGYAAMRGAFTDKGALEALRTNSQLILKAFESALKSQLPTDAKETIQKIYEKKKKFIQDIANAT